MNYDTDLQSRLPRLQVLRSHLPDASIGDLDFVISLVEEGIRRKIPPASANIVAIVDTILSADPSFAAAHLAAVARAAEQAIAVVRSRNGVP